MRIAVPVAVLVSMWAGSAAGQLYRWVEPETGAVKFSSYPPPWFDDPAKQARAPKVEVISPGKAAPAFGAAPEPEAGRADRPVEPAVGDRRGGLLKSLAQRTAELISSPPDKMGGAYLELAEALRRLEEFDLKLKPENRRDEATRLEERKQFAVSLESRRTVLLKQISSISPPPAGSPPDRIESAWANTQRLLAELGWIDNAIGSFDRSKLNARHFEMNALMDKLVAQWEAHIDPGVVRKSRGR